MEAAAIEFLFESDDESEESGSSTFSFFKSESTDSSTSSENVSANHQRIGDFMEVISSYNDSDFKKHFRLHRSTVQILIDRYKLSERFGIASKRGMPKTSGEKEIYVFLWYLANTNTFREISNLFGVSNSTAWSIVMRVISWLISIGHEYVKWPNSNEAAQNAALMEARTKMPGILGCIGVTHIRIKAPVFNKESYFNRKRCYSISVQAVVNIKKKFINIFCGEPGSLHDSRVLRRSDLYREAYQEIDELFPGNTFLLGDSSYPCLEWLIPSYKDNGAMTNMERKFNEMHASGHIIVEHAFGLLKTRFQRLLHFTEQTNINLVVNLIVCACILHNMCADNNDEFEEEDDPEFVSVVEVNQGTANSTRRQRLLDDLINTNIINDYLLDSKGNGSIVRKNIKFDTVDKLEDRLNTIKTKTRNVSEKSLKNREAKKLKKNKEFQIVLQTAHKTMTNVHIKSESESNFNNSTDDIKKSFQNRFLMLMVKLCSQSSILPHILELKQKSLKKKK